MAVRFESQAEPITGYRLIERLGSGGFGEVWKAEAPGGIFKAVKIIHGDLRNRETDAYRFAEQELKALKRVKQVRHPYLLALDRYDIVDGRLMIVMELADCNLWDRFRECRKAGLPGIPRDELMRYMAESAEVLDLMNDQFQLQHLDIKPQNLFLLYNHVKVADFGQVKDLEGMVASVTGGITPVYAAPETFDGFVSRFCDQYSLACVYQELLTGLRPFDGSSMQQLLMQHLQMPPNLAPSPPGDRPALSRALAKRPEDRFPSVSAMVQALKSGDAKSVTVPVSAVSATIAALTGMPAGLGIEDESVPPTDQAPGSNEPSSTPSAGFVATPIPAGPVPAVVPDRPAPPVQSGTGPLRPTLIIGLGYTGLRVLQRFRKQMQERYGSASRLPAIRSLFIDTDPEAVQNATADQSWAGLSALDTDEVFAARLNRAGHYLKPRLNGRTLIEGWFDPQLLYKLPRNPVTMGFRVFGRLAFCDHYRGIMQRIESELEACIDPQAIYDTQETTACDLRSNRPRVYVVAGLGGGTGGGMFLDVAYAVRHRLKKIGYSDPDVVGVLLAPPEGPPGDPSPQAQANTYAALTELHHYSRPETVFQANHDERGGVLRDSDAPFREVVLVPGLPYPAAMIGGSGVTPVTQTRMPGSIRASGTVANPGTRGTQSIRVTPDRRSGVTGRDHPAPGYDLDTPGRDPSARVAEFLRLELLTPVGRIVDDRRPPRPEAPESYLRTFGLTRLSWPRAEVVARAARVLTPVLLGHWVSPDPEQVRQVIPGWAQDLWLKLGLDLEHLVGRLAEAGDRQCGTPVLTQTLAIVEPLTPRKGWLARLPESAVVSVALDQVQRLIGRPQGVGRMLSQFEEAVNVTVDDESAAAEHELTQLLPGLIETPAFRLAGAEEAIRQVLAVLDRSRMRCEQQIAESEHAAAAAFDLLASHVHWQKGMRKLTATEFADAILQYPAQQHQLVLARAASRLYKQVRERLQAVLAEVTACRQRVDLLRPALKAEAELPAQPAIPGELLPAGCTSPEEAADHFLRSLTDEDLMDLDLRVQSGIEARFGGLLQACQNATEGMKGILQIVREQTWLYLNSRLGEVDLAGMFFLRHSGTNADRELLRLYEDAAPRLIGNGPWSQRGLEVVAAPAGPGGEPLLEHANTILPPTAVHAHSSDELLFYREYPQVPLAALPQLGPAWSNAYKAATEMQQATPHARLDVTRWTDVDEG